MNKTALHAAVEAGPAESWREVTVSLEEPAPPSPLLSALREDQALRLTRLRRQIRGLRCRRVLWAVALVTAAGILSTEWGEPLLLTNQGQTVPNPTLVVCCAVMLLAFFRQHALRNRLLALGHRLEEELRDGLQAAREAEPMGMGRLTAYAALPALALFSGWVARSAHRPESVLLRATSTGRLSEVRQALASGARTNCRNFKHVSPLHFAVARRNRGMVALLLRHGADPEYHSHYSPLRYAVLSRQPEMIRLMLPSLRRGDSAYTRVEWVNRDPNAVGRVYPAKADGLAPGAESRADPEDAAFYSRLELSLMTGDLPLIQRELRDAPRPLPEERLRLIAREWDTTEQLRVILRPGSP